jgi:hypothetical protein
VYVIILLGCTARLAVGLWFSPVPTSDAGWYIQRARELATGLGFQEGGYLTAFWPVGWPGILAVGFGLLGPTWNVVLLLNAASFASASVVVYRYTVALYGSPQIALTAISLIAIYPNNLVYAGVALSEPFFSAIALGGVYLLAVSQRWYGLASGGVLLGAAMLTKPQILFILLGIFALQVSLAGSFRARLMWFRRYGVIGVAILIILSPWTIRNYYVFERLVPVSNNGGYALLIGANEYATGTHVSDALINELLQADGVRLGDPGRQAELDEAARRKAIEWIGTYPLHYLALAPVKIWFLWSRDGEVEWEYQRGYFAYDQYVQYFRSVRVANQIFYVFLLSCFLVALARWIAGVESRLSLGLPHTLMTAGVGYVLMVTALAAIFNGQPRYHFTAMYFVCIIGSGVAWRLIMGLYARAQRLRR